MKLKHSLILTTVLATTAVLGASLILNTNHNTDSEYINNVAQNSNTDFDQQSEGLTNEQRTQLVDSFNEEVELWDTVDIQDFDLYIRQAVALVSDGSEQHILVWGNIAATFPAYYKYGYEKMSSSMIDITQYEEYTIPEGVEITSVKLSYETLLVSTKEADGEKLYAWGITYNNDIPYQVEPDNSGDIYETPQLITLPDSDESALGDMTIKKITRNQYGTYVLASDGENDHIIEWGDNSHGGLGIDELGGAYSNTNTDVIDLTELYYEELGTDYKIKDIESNSYGVYAVINIGGIDNVYYWGEKVEYSGFYDADLDTVSGDVSVPKKLVFNGNSGYSFKAWTLNDKANFAIFTNGVDNHYYTWGYTGSYFIDEDDLTSGDWTRKWEKPYRFEIDESKIPDGWEVTHIDNLEYQVFITASNGIRDKLFYIGDNIWGEAGVPVVENSMPPFKLTEISTDDNLKLYDGWKIEQLEVDNSNGGIVVDDGKNDHLFLWGFYPELLANGDVENDGTPSDNNSLDPDGEGSYVMPKFMLEQHMLKDQQLEADPNQDSIDILLTYTKEFGNDPSFPLEDVQARYKDEDTSEYISLDVSQPVETVNPDDEYDYDVRFTISGLPAGTKFGGENNDPVVITTDGFAESTLELDEFETAPKDPYMISNSDISNESIGYNDVTFNFEQKYDSKYQEDLDISDLSARIYGDTPHYLEIYEQDLSYVPEDNVDAHRIKVSGLEEGTEYSADNGNQIELSTDNFNDDIKTLDSFVTKIRRDLELSDDMLVEVDEPNYNDVTFTIKYDTDNGNLNPIDPETLEAAAIIDGTPSTLGIELVDQQIDGFEYTETYKITNLKDGVTYEYNHIKISNDGFKTSNLSLTEFTTKQKEEFILNDSKITTITPSMNSVYFTVDYIADRYDHDYLDSGTLEARLTDDALTPLEVKSMGVLYHSDNNENFNHFKVLGLESETTYGLSTNNAIQISNDGFNEQILTLDDFTTTSYEVNVDTSGDQIVVISEDGNDDNSTAIIVGSSVAAGSTVVLAGGGTTAYFVLRRRK